ncbi:MAG: hypothetical protein C4523_09055 [Myxococcales bacterium]|nr:MAG: hypothetical protein C4523_09055 [Myxococcales bacterium]
MGRAWFFAVLLIFGCASAPAGSPPPSGAAPAALTDRALPGATGTDFLALEKAFRARYEAAPVALSGRFVEESGSPLSGASVAVSGQKAVSGSDGTFRLDALPRRNALLVATCEGRRATVLAVQLALPLGQTIVELGDVELVRAGKNSVRLLFGGDAMFGRRYLDPAGEARRGEPYFDRPEALILASDPEAGARRVVQHLKPYFDSADFASANLETTVTFDPATPHRQKTYVYHTLPGSLAALKWLGLDYVSLGNNHVYDYLEKGLADTRTHLGTVGLTYSGAGANAKAAWAPYRVTLGGAPYSFVSATAIDGARYTPTLTAADTKGGAANLNDWPAARAVIAAEKAAGHIPIVQWHAGREYAFRPQKSAEALMRAAVEEGAALVVGHHPHVAEGFEIYRDALIAHSLGNLFFDQDRHETFASHFVEIDMQGATWRRAYSIPFLLENYVPKPLAGPFAARFARRLAEVSSHALVLPRLGRGEVLPEDGAIAEDINIIVEVTIPISGELVADLRAYAPPDASLLKATLEGEPVKARIGRDLFLYGDFEDIDVDEAAFEAFGWETRPGEREACLSRAFRGAAGFCLYRSAAEAKAAVGAFAWRVRLWGGDDLPDRRDLTLFGYAHGEAAGEAQLVVQLYGDGGAKEPLGTWSAILPPGDYPWTPVAVSFSSPADATDFIAGPEAVSVALRHAPPAKESGVVAFDELALIGWEESISLDGRSPLAAPHGRDFLKLTGAPGTRFLSLVFRRFSPRIAKTPN